MTSLPALLSERVEAVAGVDPELRPATKPQFGHFQSNVALRLAKTEGVPPREIAQRIVDKLEIDDLCETPDIAGPGFINFRLRTSVLAAAVNKLAADENLGISQVAEPERVVIDYSSPNVAKQMHVGHLRSTIIGDCFNRVLSATGEDVIAQNHIGDWGRQFGMLIEQIIDEDLDLGSLDLAGAEELYKRANESLNSSEEFADRARARVVKLQGGDEATREIWERLIEISKAGFNNTYRRLNVLLDDDDLAGESTYNEFLNQVAEDLQSRGIAVEDQGALVVFVDGFDAPAIIRNSAGGYGYDVTDIAAIRYRVNELKADRIIYVTDARQANHFALAFAVARKAGYLPDSVKAEHVGFGMVLGPDGKPFKTREGTAVHLDDLLDDAEKNATPEVALAAIKYADLSSGLQKDYVFDVERMTATSGDTGPYLQYAHARCANILREAEARGFQPSEVGQLAEPAEQDLALQLSGFGNAVHVVAADLTPHKLCGYLYELADKFSKFYEKCPVLKSADEVRASRLGLVAATKQVLAAGLGLLGIVAPERM
ncbi:arginine--tRNA ligase [Propionimicrobium lymphophilum]|uniref:arginine--tRNA ligase n=1 Tax=Propionimicrobium lymphophilum TaxID=33012 RepID=UPI00254B4396|nr:arginine--tRNA ligase [Propionimicrobium lymphophilum]MDK7708933.1 arginine--tRNA ligase [Propionimicrobium lymphophilum]MDK7733120.1 arginine--tRNA ligase [Propionimicrobium lymphophilum]